MKDKIAGDVAELLVGNMSVLMDGLRNSGIIKQNPTYYQRKVLSDYLKRNITDLLKKNLPQIAPEIFQDPVPEVPVDEIKEQSGGGE